MYQKIKGHHWTQLCLPHTAQNSKPIHRLSIFSLLIVEPAYIHMRMVGNKIRRSFIACKCKEVGVGKREK